MLRSLALAVLAAILGLASAFPAPARLSRRKLAGDDHGHAHDHGTKEPCGCEAAEEDHPFKINCDDKAAIQAAETYLIEQCPVANMTVGWYEWAGIFPTAGPKYIWRAQATGDPLAYADPMMGMVLLAAPEATMAELVKLEPEAVESYYEAGERRRRRLAHPDHTEPCEEVVSGATLTPMPHKCYMLKFNEDLTDSHWDINTESTNALAIFTAHNPMEFERDTHFLQDPAGEDIETPEPGTLNQDKGCSDEIDGVKTCQQAFFTIQAHHDYCNHTVLTTAQELLMHDYENNCAACKVDRMYMPGMPLCDKVPDETCLDQKNNETHPWYTAQTAIAYLAASCPAGPDGTVAANTCCSRDGVKDLLEINAFDIIYVYHEYCGTHIPEEIEDGLHFYEEACEDFLCNTVAEPFDPNVCPTPPTPPMTWQEQANANGWRPCTTKVVPGTSTIIPKEDEHEGHAHHRSRRLAGQLY